MYYLLFFVHSRLFPPPTHFLLQMFPHFTTFSHTFRVQGCRLLRAGSALCLLSPLREMGDRSPCQMRSRGREKVLACGREKVQWEGEGVQVYFGERGTKACKQGRCGKEGRRGWMVICVLRDGRSEISVCPRLGDGRAHRAGICAGFEEGACSRPQCSQARGPTPFLRQTGLPPRFVLGA